MDMSLRAIRDPGDRALERVVLRAQRNLDIGEHLLIAARTSAAGKTLGGRIPFCFWFPDREIREGDLVVVYSKSGYQKQKENSSGAVSHFLYWGLEDPIWQDDSYRPVVMEIARWKSLAKAMVDADQESGE